MNPIACRVIAAWSGGEMDYCGCIIRLRSLDGDCEVFARTPHSERFRLPSPGTAGNAVFDEKHREWGFEEA